MTGPLMLRPNSELVAAAWLATVPGLAPDLVATQLPTDQSSWADTGFVTVGPVLGGSPGLQVPMRAPVLSLDSWAVRPSSNRPPWGHAINLLERVIQASYLRGAKRRVVLPGQFPVAVVHAAFLVTEPRRVYGDPGGLAHYNSNLALRWTAID